MAEIVVDLSEQDVLNACKIFAVTRVLNEGRATRAFIAGGADGVTVSVHVETDRMNKSMPHYAPSPHTGD